MNIGLSRKAAAKKARTTSVSLNERDLAVLGRLVAAGQVILESTKAEPVVARLKAAMTRLGVQTPKGL